MTASLDTRIRRTGFLLAALAAAVAVAAPAYGNQGTPPQSAVDNASATWAAKAKLLGADGHPMLGQLPPLSAIDNAGATWAGKARLLGADGRPLAPAVAIPSTTGSQVFQWDDFGIGAGAVLGLVLVAIGLGAGAHYSRRGRLREQQAA